MTISRMEINERRDIIICALPELGRRIFLLHWATYAGYGFHYDMERKFGKLLHKANDLNNSHALSIKQLMVLETAYDDLMNEVKGAEKSAKIFHHKPAA